MWMPAVEVHNGILGISDVCRCFPRVVRFGIAFPFDQILQCLPSSEASGSDDCFDFEFFLSFDQVRGWFRVVETIDFVLLVGRESTSMENIVDALPAVGQFQPKVDSSDGVCNFKWPKVFGSEFLRGVVSVDILSI